MKTAITAITLSLMFLIPALACGANTTAEPNPTARAQPTTRPTVASLNPLPTSPPITAVTLSTPTTSLSPAPGQPTQLPTTAPGQANDDNGNQTSNQAGPTTTPLPTPTYDMATNPTPTASAIVLVAQPTSTPTPTPTPAPPPDPTATPVYYSMQFTEANYDQVADGLVKPPEARPERYCSGDTALVRGRFGDASPTYDSTPDGIKQTANYAHVMGFAYGLDEGETITSATHYRQPQLLAKPYRDVLEAHYNTIGYDDDLLLIGCAQIEVMHPEVPIIRYLWNFRTHLIHRGEIIDDLWSLHAYYIVENAPELEYTTRPYKVRVVGNQVHHRMVTDACELAMPVGKLSGCQ